MCNSKGKEQVRERLQLENMSSSPGFPHLQLGSKFNLVNPHLAFLLLKCSRDLLSMLSTVTLNIFAHICTPS